MTTRRFLSRIHSAVQYDSGWRGHCPVHGFPNTYLSIWDGGHGLAFSCSNGCSTDEILLSLGLAGSDLSSHGAADCSDLEMQQRRDAELLLASATGEISSWTDEKLNDELTRIADAHEVLERPPAASLPDGVPRLAETFKTPVSIDMGKRAFRCPLLKFIKIIAAFGRICVASRLGVQAAQPWWPGGQS
jgi:hypothetical protein